MKTYRLDIFMKKTAADKLFSRVIRAKSHVEADAVANAMAGKEPKWELYKPTVDGADEKVSTKFERYKGGVHGIKA